MNQSVALSIGQVVDLVTEQARMFADELIRDGVLGASGGKAEALLYDLAVAQIQVLRRRGYLISDETEKAAIAKLLMLNPDEEFETDDSAIGVPILSYDGQTLDIPELEPGVITITHIGRKLDLAKTYMEMGNPEGAHSILEDVLEDEAAARDKIRTRERKLERSSG
jgi:FimV-like protein